MATVIERPKNSAGSRGFQPSCRKNKFSPELRMTVSAVIPLAVAAAYIITSALFPQIDFLTHGQLHDFAINVQHLFGPNSKPAPDPIHIV